MATAAINLRESIQAGIDKLGEPPATVEFEESPAEKVVKVAKGEDEQPVAGAETGEGEGIGDEELSDEELANAKILFKALNNQATAKGTLQFLATQMGIELPTEKAETKSEAREQTKDIIDQLKEKFPSLDFIPNELGPIIKQYVEEQVSAVRNDVESERVERANKELQNDSAKAMKDVASKFNYKDNLIPANILNEMTKTMSKIQPSADMSPLEFITHLHDAARAKLGIIEVKKSLTPAHRLASERVVPGRGSKTGESELPKKMTLKQAIAASVEQLSAQ